MYRNVLLCGHGVMSCGGFGVWLDKEALRYTNVLEDPPKMAPGASILLFSYLQPCRFNPNLKKIGTRNNFLSR
jgi:hypothetical protein